MSTNISDFLRAHGIDGPEPSTTAEFQAPVTTTHRGMTSHETLDRLAETGRLRDLYPLSGAAPTLALVETATERLYHSNEFPGIWLLDVEGVQLVASERAMTTADGALVLDGRDPDRPAFALLQDGATRLVLELFGPRARAATVSGPIGPLALLPDGPAPIELPPATSLLGACPSREWMTKKFALASHAGPYERVAAVGTVARLWPTDEARALGVDVMALLRERRGPLDRARVWFAQLSDDQRDAVFDGAYLEIDRLHDALERLLVSCANDPAGASPEALSWLERRDDLQSVLIITPRGEDADALRAALDQLDREAEAYASTWDALELQTGTPQLEACADEESHQWWAEVLL